MNKSMMGWGAVIVGILIILSEVLTWPSWTSYLWGILVLLWGLMSFK